MQLIVAPSSEVKKCIFQRLQLPAEEGEYFDCLVVMELATCLGQVNRRFPSVRIVASDLAMASNFMTSADCDP